MEALMQSLKLHPELTIIGMLLLTGLATGLFGIITDIWRQPTGGKTATMSVIAFTFGVVAVYLAR